MKKVKFPPNPPHPERICWGCEHLCPADALRCGMDTVRAQHPVELGLTVDAED